jgi:hypothetical protein
MPWCCCSTTGQLSSAAYEDFCRQIAFELGECYTQTVDLKEQKFVEKRKATLAATGVRWRAVVRDIGPEICDHACDVA